MSNLKIIGQKTLNDYKLVTQVVNRFLNSNFGICSGVFVRVGTTPKLFVRNLSQFTWQLTAPKKGGT